eukprot:CAMPEP_0201577034 /NCGR_PEP_ID=MMETSP0190_2-20130828/23203_1 /ASSEMBLY_ACC=CAM_ASM_000263 /TAXON_ID=37353 /ORGANISM="Rosalina sp." /LENGTH=87 /DNA_ID=CAMNT_0048008619 /DNA_START=154 /DNA_END=414 /DNA_ORIENTATION=-
MKKQGQESDTDTDTDEIHNNSPPRKLPIVNTSSSKEVDQNNMKSTPSQQMHWHRMHQQQQANAQISSSFALTQFEDHYYNMNNTMQW